MLPFLKEPTRLDEAGGIDGILRAVREHLGMEASFVSQFVNGRRVFRHVHHAEGLKFVEVGDGDPLEESYCHWIAVGRLPELIRNPADHPFTAQLAATKELPVGAHLSVPIRLRDGAIYGTFCCFSRKPDRSLNQRDLSVMRAFADLAAEQIQAEIDRDHDQKLLRSRLRAILDRRDFDIVFQPAIRIDSPQVAFVEAFSRFRPGEPDLSTEAWFEAAHRLGLGVELELLAAQSALACLESLPAGTAMSINLSPATLLSGEMSALVAGVPLDRLIIEVTEHRAIVDYAELAERVDPLRRRGLRLAVDDAGAGYASLKHILSLRPDIIKLDMSLSRGIDGDPVRRALAAALINFAWSIGGDLVAEGVESPAELSTLRDLGIGIVQGHLCARPAALDELALDAIAA
jgi:EAL domain-containing protein (putative c-di-GMP-specific phosphodiesterase class I)